MAVESVQYISDLVQSNPANSSPRSQGAAHLRLIKQSILQTFPQVRGQVSVSHTEMNYLSGLEGNVEDRLDSLEGVTEDLGSMAYRDVTFSTNEPSGGANGDVWFQYE